MEPTFEFETTEHQRCYGVVATFGRELFGEITFRPLEDISAFDMNHGSANIQILVIPVGQDRSVVRVVSCLITDVEISGDLCRYLLELNADLPFGGFSLDEEGDICISHTIVGQTLDKEELAASVRNICEVADRYDDAIRDIYGGKRAVD